MMDLAHPSSNAAIEILAFRYIEQAQATPFAQRMGQLGIPLIAPRGNGLEGVPPSADPDLWDYPPFQYEQKEPMIFDRILDEQPSARPTHSILLQAHVLYIEQPPIHFPFAYTLAFLFGLKDPSPSRPMLEHLSRATAGIKLFTNHIWNEGDYKYRPVYWFLKGVSSPGVGIRGNAIKFTLDQSTECHIERGFPYSSYIIHDLLPSEKRVHIDNLALLSVITHMIERHYRRRLARLAEDILRLTRQLDELQSLPTEANELTYQINEVFKTQQKIRPQLAEFYAIRRTLVRSKGLVERVRALCGAPGENNLFDIVCDDAMAVIESESAVFIDEIESRFDETNAGVNVLFNQLHSRRSDHQQSLTTRIAELGYYLQSTAVAFLWFQILEKLYPMQLEGSPQYENASLVILSTLAAFFVALFGFRKLLGK